MTAVGASEGVLIALCVVATEYDEGDLKLLSLSPGVTRVSQRPVEATEAAGVNVRGREYMTVSRAKSLGCMGL